MLHLLFNLTGLKGVPISRLRYPTDDAVPLKKLGQLEVQTLATVCQHFLSQ